jgi:hypothetical protein
MLSYFINRHYHALTQLLPPDLRVDQPQKIYYKTFISERALKLLEENRKVTHKTLASSRKVEQPKKSFLSRTNNINGY